MIEANETGYKIGAVSRITGIGVETLRAWERRYNAVIPMRSNAGDRNYSRENVAKLLLLKTCTDSGVSISKVANLETVELKKVVEDDLMLNHVHTRSGKEQSINVNQFCRVALVGDWFPVRVVDGLEDIQKIKVTGTFNSIDEIESKLVSDEKIDVVVFEQPTINKNTKSQIERIRDASNALHIILIYGFSNQQDIENLQNNQTTVVRSSVDIQELARLCIYHSGGSEKLPSLEQGSTLYFEQTVPTRSFSNKQLGKLAGISNTIKCECPLHVTNLVRDLVAFEVYSAECENQNSDDAALHAYFHATTAQARSMLEDALSHLIRVEGISLTD